MKRTWIIFTLLFAGLIICSSVRAGSSQIGTSEFTTTLPADRVTETESQILEDAAPEVGITFEELVTLYEDGEATIEDLGNNYFRVTAYVSSGNPIVAVIESAL